MSVNCGQWGLVHCRAVPGRAKGTINAGNGAKNLPDEANTGLYDYV